MLLPSMKVQKILDVRRQGQGWQDVVEWEGYDPGEQQWIPIWIWTCSGSSTGTTQTSPVDRQEMPIEGKEMLGLFGPLGLLLLSRWRQCP